MSQGNSTTTRRTFLRAAGLGAAAVPLAGLVPVTVAGAAEMPKLSIEDSTAKALGYVQETATAGQQCNNCNFWQGGDATWGGCTLFPGKNVSAGGWCKSWINRA